jgi:hypothetical protein
VGTEDEGAEEHRSGKIPETLTSQSDGCEISSFKIREDLVPKLNGHGS